MGTKFSNFKDPIGLIKRMIMSRNQAARATLFREVLSLIGTPISRILSPLESQSLHTLSPSTQPILLIVGPPRSGSSLIYQTLAHYLPVSYFSNLSALFPHIPITIERFVQPSSRLSRTSSLDVCNFYGNSIGLADPNDGFHIWNRWLGSDRYCVPDQISTLAQEDMCRFFSAWATVSQKPLLNKNNRNTAAIQLLNETLNHVFWIIVERDPLYIAQSLIIAREMVQGDRNRGWGLYSKASSSESQSPLEAVVDQVYQIDRDIQRQTQDLDPEQYLKVSYEAFCLDPSQFVQTIYARFWKSESALLPDFEIPPYACQNKMKLPAQEFTQLQTLINQKFVTLA